MTEIDKENVVVGGKISFGGYDWRVLAVEGNKALIISEFVIIDKEIYHSEFEDITWEECTLRKHLNSEFYSTLDSTLQSQICETCNANNDNQWSRATGGNDTADKIFCLSLEEVCCYFGDSLTNLKKGKGATGSALFISDENNSNRAANNKDGKPCWWWLRTPGFDNISAAGIGADGTIRINGYSVDDNGGGVRPAFWISL